MTRGFRDEIVDDSEPEREKLRWERKKFDTRVRTIPHKPPTRREVIELTDHESEGDDLQPPDMIEISDCTSDSSSHEILSIPKHHPQSLMKQRDMTCVYPEAESQLAPKALKTPPPSLPPSTSSKQPDVVLHSALPHNVSPNDIEDGDESVNFGRYAFIGSRPSINDPSSGSDPSRKRSSTVIGPSTTKAPPKRKAVTKHQFSGDFSDAELAKLTTCVSCNAHWTTRKTATQKMKHVLFCAKKHSFNDETIRFLIRKEIESVVGTVGKVAEKKGIGKVPPAQSPTPKTFYEHIVTDAAPKKKGRRMETGESVRSVTATRNAILDRARVILDSVSSQYPAEASVSSPACEPSVGTDNCGIGDLPKSTQPFGRSALAQRHRTDTRYILADFSPSPSRSEEEESVLPATQVFAPSKFGDAAHRPHALFEPRKDVLPSGRESQATSVSIDTWVNPTNEPPLIHLPNAISGRERSLSPVSRRRNMPISGRIILNSLAHTFRKQCNIDDIQDPCEQISEREMDNDNAYMHFDPGADNQQQLMAPSGSYILPKATSLPRSPGNISIVHSPEPKPKKPVQSQVTYTADICVKDSPRKKDAVVKRKGKGKRQVEPEDDVDELWDARMKDVIVRDTDLYLRILRYEPIHFDVFLKLATDEFSCSASGKLKAHLRRYLDKEAISFYGNGRRR